MKSKLPVVLGIVVVFFGAIFGYVYWMNRGLIDQDTRAVDLVLLFGSTVMGVILAGFALNLLMAPAMKMARENPSAAKTRMLVSLVVFLGILGLLPWAIRSAWGYRSILAIVLGVFFVLLALLAGLVVAAVKKAKKQA